MLVKAEFKIKLRAVEKRNGDRERHNIHWMKEKSEIENDFKDHLRNNWRKASDITKSTAEEMWANYKDFLKTTAIQTVGYKKNSDKPYTTKATRDKIQEQKLIKLEMLGRQDEDVNNST